MMSPSLIITVSFIYLLILFAIAYYGDKRAEAGRSVISLLWVYYLLMEV